MKKVLIAIALISIASLIAFGQSSYQFTTQPAGTRSTQPSTTDYATPAGFGLLIPAYGVQPTDLDTNTGSMASTAYLEIVNIPAPMLVEKLGYVVVTAQASQNLQWGLFDFSASQTAATLVVGTSGNTAIPNALNYQTTAAATPTVIKPGIYALIVFFPAGTNASLQISRSVNKSITFNMTMPLEKFQLNYTWTNTPDLTTGWTTDSVVVNFWIHGNLNAGTAW